MRPLSMAALRAGVGGVLSLVAFHASAFPFELGPVKARLDTTVSVGATFRMEGQDQTLIGIANGGTSRSVNDDDGNFGFENGDVVSAVAKATHDLELTWGDYGLFSRFSYFYDQAAHDADRLENRVVGGIATADRERGQYELGRRGYERLEKEGDLLDLFVYGRFDVFGRGLSVRFGKQVVSWGESTFIQNGINSINPIDVARIRTPGAEIKEALIPIAMLWTSFSITDTLSIEGVWMTEYEKTRIDPRGSFFSTNDFVSDDGNKAIVSFGRREDDNSVTRSPAGPNPGSAAVWVPREKSPDVADAEKQFGVALRYFAEALGNTELGLFYLNYHSRTPLVSAVRGGGGAGNTTHMLNSALPTCSQDAANPACRATFFSEFPGNIKLYGLSFNTDGPWGIALQGEYSYRPEQPIQLSGTEVLLTALGLPNTISMTPLAAGTYIPGYREVEMHQAQTTLTKAFGPTFGAQQFVMLGEIAYNYLNLPDNGLVFNGPGAGLPSCTTPAPVLAAVSNGSCQEAVGGGYASKSSWGYRLVNRMDFENVIGPLGLSPRLVFAHDVNGVGPNFNKDTKAVTVGVGFNYLQRWQADIGYTAFFGGRTYSGTDAIAPGTVLPGPTQAPGDASQSASFATSANPNKDRDFLAISLSYAF